MGKENKQEEPRPISHGISRLKDLGLIREFQGEKPDTSEACDLASIEEEKNNSFESKDRKERLGENKCSGI